MRTRADVEADMAALGRPRFPLSPTPAALAGWREAKARWLATRPDGDEAWEALLGELDAAEREARDAREGARRLEESGVPSRLAAQVAQARPDVEPMAVARSWWSGDKAWLVLMGGVGVGKSLAAAWVVREATLQGLTAMWASSAELSTRAGGFDGAAYGWRLKGADVLVLDDVGVDHDSDFARSVRAEVLTHRHEEACRTVLTTNLAGRDFAARLGARLADRVRSSCVAREFRGGSLR